MTRLPARFVRAATVDGRDYPPGASAELSVDDWRRLHAAGAILSPRDYAEHERREQIEREAREAAEAEERARQRREAAEQRAREAREQAEAEDRRREASDALHRTRGDVRIVCLSPLTLAGSRVEAGAEVWVSGSRYRDLHSRGLVRAVDADVERAAVEAHRSQTVARLRREAEAGDASAAAALEAMGETS